MRKNLVKLVVICALVLVSITPVFSAGGGSKNVSVKGFKSGNLFNGKQENKLEVLKDYMNESQKGKHSALSFELNLERTREDNSTLYKINQTLNGVKVLGLSKNIVVDNNSNVAVDAGNDASNLTEVNSVNDYTRINEKRAIEVVAGDIGISDLDKKDFKVERIVYASGNNANYSYQINVRFMNPVPGNWYYIVGASNGQIFQKYNAIDTGRAQKPAPTPTTKPTPGPRENSGIGFFGDTKLINTYYNNLYYLQDTTRGGMVTYNAKLNRSNGYYYLYDFTDVDGLWNDSIQKAAVDAHKYAAVSYDYYKTNFARNSYDNLGTKIESVVHYGKNYNNAYWDGQYLVYGDGDGIDYRSFSAGVDVVAHELTHAVSDFAVSPDGNGLIYSGESGALSESLSDVFGTLIEFYNEGLENANGRDSNPRTNADWLIGEDITISATALRSFENPKIYGQPDTYADRYLGTLDNGGVHRNSGILNKAAFLISQGFNVTQGDSTIITYTGVGKDKLSQIYYKAMEDFVVSTSTFLQFRANVVQAATELNYLDAVATINAAFDQVGVK